MYFVQSVILSIQRNLNHVLKTDQEFNDKPISSSIFRIWRYKPTGTDNTVKFSVIENMIFNLETRIDLDTSI